MTHSKLAAHVGALFGGRLFYIPGADGLLDGVLYVVILPHGHLDRHTGGKRPLKWEIVCLD